jgi:histidinol-phosphate aminotransferase
MYGVAARIQGAELLEVPLDRAAGFALDEALLLASVTAKVKLVFLCTPNNPTGNALTAASVERIAARLEGRALVVVDEAYAEFGEAPSLVTRVGRIPNLVVLRTLSKAYALAGARCGAVIADASVVELLRRIRPPYALTTPTAEAVLAALEPAALERARLRIDELKAERTRLSQGLAALDLVRRVWPSSANFVLAECRDASVVLTRARAAGFLLRDLSRTAWTPDAVRISVGTPEQNERLLAGLAA